MNNKQKIVNTISILTGLVFYVVLYLNNDNQSAFVQNLSLSLIFLSSLILVVSNIIHLKSSSNKLVVWFFIIVGLVIAIYFGWILYLVLAFRKGIGF